LIAIWDNSFIPEEFLEIRPIEKIDTKTEASKKGCKKKRRPKDNKFSGIL
jgi:hypothetical protein